MNTTVYVIRHGLVENPENILYTSEIDVSLSTKGKEQIQRLAEKFKSQNVIPTQIISSPLLRTKQTSEIISNVLGKVPIVYSTNITEVKAQGLATQTLAWGRNIDLYNYSGPVKFSIESIAHQKERMLKEVNNLVSRNPGKTMFLVSHGDPIAVAYTSLIYPNEVITSSTQLRKHYLSRGQAWKLVFDSNLKIVHNELINV